MKRSLVLCFAEGMRDARYPLLKKWVAPVQERIAYHPRLDEPIIAEFSRGTFQICNERYPSVERVADQYFPGFLPRTKEDYEALADKSDDFTVEELMLEQIGLWNVNMLVREYNSQMYTGVKLSTPLQWEVAGLEDLLPKYYKAYRSVATYFMRRYFSFYQAETIVASPKYKIGGVIPQIMHVTEIGYRKMVLVYPVCHNDFEVYPQPGETRYAQQPLDFLLYSHLNYYHVVLNMYKWIFVQEGHCEPDDVISMVVVNMSLEADGEVKARLYMVETDDRIREAMERRFAGVGPAVDTLSSEWFERKDLWKEELNDLETNKDQRELSLKAKTEKSDFEVWKKDVKIREDIFTKYIEQQQRELAEDRKKLSWRIKNFIWQRILGGQGPVTRDMFSSS